MKDHTVSDGRPVGAYLNHWYQAGLREDNFIYRLYEVSTAVTFEKLTSFWDHVISKEPHIGWSAKADQDGNLRLMPSHDAPCENILKHITSSAASDVEKFKVLKQAFWNAKTRVKFDGSAPLAQVVLVQFDDGSQYLILLLHHLTIDELGMLLIMQDMERHFAVGGQLQYASLANSFETYARYTQDYIDHTLPQERAYWATIKAQANDSGLCTDTHPADENLDLEHALQCYQSMFAPVYQDNRDDVVQFDQASAYVGLVLDTFTAAQMDAIASLKNDSNVDLELVFIWALSQTLTSWRTSSRLWMDVMTSGRHVFKQGLHLFGARCSCVELCTISLDFDEVENTVDPVEISQKLATQRQRIPTSGFGYHAMELPTAQAADQGTAPAPHPSVEFNFTAPLKDVFDREASFDVFRKTPFYLGPQYDPELVKYDLYFGIDRPTGSDAWSLCIRFNTRKFAFAEAQKMAATLMARLQDAAATLGK